MAFSAATTAMDEAAWLRTSPRHIADGINPLCGGLQFVIYQDAAVLAQGDVRLIQAHCGLGLRADIRTFSTSTVRSLGSSKMHV